jgi:hypothetical protein
MPQQLVAGLFQTRLCDIAAAQVSRSQRCANPARRTALIGYQHRSLHSVFRFFGPELQFPVKI